MAITLVLGGVRSGKSAFAEQLAAQAVLPAASQTASQTALQPAMPVVYIATATAGDAEMAARIAHHRARRPAAWHTVEAPLDLAGALQQHAAANTCVLVDCLTLWLSNLLFDGGTDYPDNGPIDPGLQFTQRRDALLNLLPHLPGDIVLVSNETGFGVTPMGAVSRFFVDESGRLHQHIAALAQRVRLIVAGCPVAVKG